MARPSVTGAPCVCETAARLYPKDPYRALVLAVFLAALRDAAQPEAARPKEQPDAYRARMRDRESARAWLEGETPGLGVLASWLGVEEDWLREKARKGVV